MFQYINNDMHKANLLDLHDAPKHTNLALKKNLGYDRIWRLASQLSYQATSWEWVHFGGFFFPLEKSDHNF